MTDATAHRPPTSIMALADLATPMAVRVAASLDLADHEGTAAELAATTGADEPALRRVLDHLVAVGVFARDARTGRYRPTALGAQMREDSPEGVKPLLDVRRAGGRAELAFVELLDTVVTGAPAYPRRYGAGFWADLDAHPALRRSFDAQMHWRLRVQAPQIAADPVWGRVGSILDVGGGDGTTLAAILAAHSGVRADVLDLAPTAEAARERFAAAGLADRAGAVTGSFFDPLPTGYDAYLLCDILHDWDDDRCREILAGARRAAAPGGTVLVVDATARPDAGATAADLFMLMCFGGRRRSVDEIDGLARDAGLALRAAHPVTDERALLELGVTSR